MACPVHIWVPLIAAAAPLAHVVRTQVRSMRDRITAPTEADAPRDLKRWAPVGVISADDPSPNRTND